MGRWYDPIVGRKARDRLRREEVEDDDATTSTSITTRRMTNDAARRIADTTTTRILALLAPRSVGPPIDFRDDHESGGGAGDETRMTMIY
jgi:hypothetical protein